MTKRGYVALHRSVFENPKLAGKFSKREAWIWLFAHAAWEPTIHKLKRGPLTVGRGELATTTRHLARTWGWSQTSTRRFIGFLKREKMCLVALPGSLKLVRGMVITICNYGKFQVPQKSRTGKAAHYPAHSGQKSFLLPITCNAEEPNKRIDRSTPLLKEAKGGRKPGRYRHRQVSKHGTMFLLAGTSCHADHSADFEAVLGYRPTPDRDGGNWFWPAGEAERPQRLFHLRPSPPMQRTG